MKIVIAGAGSVGTYLVERLNSEDHDILVVDNSEKILQKLSSHFDIQTALGSASSLRTLREAGVESADIYIAATNSDETNLISCLLADSLNQDMRKIARVRELVTDESGLSSRITTVFDQFINPDFETASNLLRLFEIPGAIEIMEFGRGRIWVIGVMPEPDAPIIGKCLHELPELYSNRDALIVALIRGGELVIPTGDDRVELGDELFVAALPQNISKFFEVLGKPQNEARNVMVYGGTAIGRYVAQGLADREIKVKLIEPDESRSETLAQEMSSVLVLNGMGTDQELLKEEGVADVDIFVGAAADEEKNILAAILAKKLGAKQNAVVLANRSYLNLVSEIGIDVAINPQIAAASRILKFIRRGSVSSIFSTRDDQAEVLEIVASEGSEIINTELKDLKLPSGVIVAAVYSSDDVKIPMGDTVIRPGERVVFFADRKALPKLQTLLDSKKPLF